MPSKLVDSTALHTLSYQVQIGLKEGLEEVYQYNCKNENFMI